LVTPAVIDYAQIGAFRIGVYYDSFDSVFAQVTKRYNFVSFDVRYRKMLLGTRDTITGWRAVTYDTASTKEMLIVSPSMRAMVYSATGLLSSYSLTGYTADVVFKGDQITSDNGWYKITNIRFHTVGDSFQLRECQLEELPLYQES